MRTSFFLGLALAAGSLGTVAQAQPVPNQPMSNHTMPDRPMPDHSMPDHMDQGHRGDRPMRGPERRDMVSRDQSIRLRAAIGDLNSQVTRAHQARRLTPGQFGGFQNEIKSVQSQYWGKMDQGMTRGEYGSVTGSIARLRTQLQRTVAMNDHRRR